MVRIFPSPLLTALQLLLFLLAISSASYFKQLASYWRSVEERYLSGLDNDDLFDGDAIFDGTPCRGFTACLKSSGVDFAEFGDYRCGNLSRLFNCYTKVKNDCAKKGLSGWQHVFSADNSDKIALPLPSLDRFSRECESSGSLFPILHDMKRDSPLIESQCQATDLMKKYFATGMIHRESVFDAPSEMSPDVDDTAMRLSCRFFLSAVNEGYFAYRVDKSGPAACYPSILQRTCSVLDMASKNFIRHCKTLLGSATQVPTAAAPFSPVTPSFFPESCPHLLKSSSSVDLNSLRTSNNRRFVGFVREDAVFPVRTRIAFSPSDEAALPPEKCQLSELGWVTLLANQFYKISGLVRKNGTQGYLVEVEVQLFREPLNSSAPATAPTTSPSKVTVITVPQVQHTLQTGLHDLAGHGRMRLRNIKEVGTLALIQLVNSRTNCALLRYSGLDRYHIRCRMPFDLVSRSFGLLVDGCETPSSRLQDAKPQEREGDIVLEKLLQYDLTLVTDALFDLEKDSGFWSPKRINQPAFGKSAAASSAASSFYYSAFHSSSCFYYYCLAVIFAILFSSSSYSSSYHHYH